MKFDLSKLNNTKLEALEVFPLLTRYEEFVTPKLEEYDLPLDKVIKFVLWCYGQRSDLAGEADLSRRKLEAITRAGFKPVKKGEFPEAVVALLNSRFYEVTRMITRLLRLERNREFAMWISNLEAFDQVQEELRMPVVGLEDDKKMRAYELKLKLSAESVVLAERIKKQEESLFQNDEDLIDSVNAIGTAKSDFEAGWAEKFATNVG